MRMLNLKSRGYYFFLFLYFFFYKCMRYIIMHLLHGWIQGAGEVVVL